MKPSKLCIFIVGFVFSMLAAVSFLNAETILGTNNVARPKIDILSSTAYGLKIQFSINDISSKIRDTKEGKFIFLHIPGTQSMQEIGKPQLPCYRTFIEVPFGAEPIVTIKDLSIKKAFLAKPVYPTQAPIPKIPGAIERAEFNYDREFYSKSRFSPERIVNIKEAGIVREHRLFLLEINPVSYNPKTGELEVKTSIELEITFSHPNIGYSIQRLKQYSNPQFEKFVKGFILNYGAIESMIDYPGIPIGYLIIVYDNFESNITPFAEWKKQKGYYVTVTRTSDIPGGPTTGNIQAYILEAYNSWPIPPAFVLLVGDEPQIPAFTGSQTSKVTDLYYAAISGGDYFPDLWLGRFSAETSTHVDVMVEKVVDYEKTDWSSGTDWIKKAVFMASSDNHNISEGTHRYVILTHLDPRGYVSDSLWHYYGATTQDVKDALNDGRSLAIYSGHGGNTSWGDGPPFSQGDVQSLTNLDMYPMVSSHACNTGNFGYYAECFAETWVRVANKGGISFWGSAPSSYWTEDDTLERAMFDELFYNNLTWLAGMQDAALYRCYLAGFSMAKYYYEAYNLFGDPSMMLWTEVPQILTVNHPPVIPIGPYSISVTVMVGASPVDSALVAALVKSTDSLVTAYTVGGNAVLPVYTPGVDSVFITVTGYNLEPYYGGILAMSSGPYVGYLKSVIDDIAGGNGDGVANPGETIDWEVWLKNYGNDDAIGVYGLLSITDPYISISVDSSWYGNIASGDSATGSVSYTFSIANNCPDGYTALFDLDVHDANGTIWYSHPSITVYDPPVLTFQDYTVVDVNGILDPGETANFFVTIENEGGAVAENVTSTLTTSSSFITINDSSGNFGTIDPGNTANNSADPYNVTADTSTPPGSEVDFTIIVQAGVYNDTLDFTMVVGQSVPSDTGYYYVYYSGGPHSQSPVFNWIAIDSSQSTYPGTSLDLGDAAVAQVNLPFTFTYYGLDYNQVTIGSDGWIAMGYQTMYDQTNSGIPDPDGPSAMIAGLWDDLNPGNIGQPSDIYYYYDTANHRFIVEYFRVEHWPSGYHETFEIILYDPGYHPTPTGDGEIIVQYLLPMHQSDNTLGIENYSETIGIQYYYDGTYHELAVPVTNSFALKYTTYPPEYVGIEDKPVSVLNLPKVYGLSNSYPNPCCNMAVINYQIPRKGEVSLRVYDISGRLADVLIDGVLEPGYHSLRLDTKGYASGIYFYRLIAGGKTFTRKMIVVK